MRYGTRESDRHRLLNLEAQHNGCHWKWMISTFSGEEETWARATVEEIVELKTRGCSLASSRIASTV